MPQPVRPGSTDQDEEARAFYQRRLSMVLGGQFAFVAFATAAGMLLLLTGVPITARYMLPRFSGMAFALVLFVMWRHCRRGRLSWATLDRLDFWALVPNLWIFLATTSMAGIGGKITGYQLLVVTYVLMARAIVVPSTGRRSLWMALLVTVPLTGIATYLRVIDPRMGENVGFALLVVAHAAIVTTLLVYFTSRVIFRLRKDVRHATKVGQYVLEKKIGEGGMGVVYRATHAMLRREAAVKLLWPDLVGEAHLARFEREVTLTARLTHPNTIVVFDYGRTPEGVFYYTMEYLDGLSLEELVEAEGALPPGRVVHLLAQACGALAEAHRIGLIHRDIKPANVLLCERGGIPDHVKVLDFGLVKEVAASKADTSMAGAIIGTPLYMSPEAVRGEALDARADIYALGALGYVLLTGTPPFPGPTSVEACFQHLHEAVEPPSRRANRPVPASLEALLIRCLAKSRDERPATMSELREALLVADGFPRWSEADGARWWAERGPAARARARTERKKAGDGSDPSKRTIAVQLGNRLPRSEPAPALSARARG